MHVRAPVLLVLLALWPAAVPAQAPAAAPAPIAAVESMWPGVSLEVTEFRRKGNTLSVKLVLRNSGSAPADVDVTYDDVYVLDTAGGKRYDVLRDDKGTVIAAHLPSWPERWYGELAPGGSMTLWMKFPAPPAETTSASLVVGANQPLEELAITDA
jgi:hypothetical protein